MPEIGEVARIVHFLRKHAVGKTIAKVTTQEDNIVYGKAGTSAEDFEEAMTGKKVLDARQQGKYFWLVMSSPPHPVMHLGMTGWIKFSSDDSSYYKPTKVEDTEWPPKYWKFVLQMKGNPDSEVAFVDARRLARIRLVDTDGEKLRQTTPLKENGPDPVIDSDILTQEWLAQKLRKKRVPVKAFLLDQANISGVGNWVGDEVLYQARLHPEQYSNTFSDTQIKHLHDALMEVCKIACETFADTSKFPETWLMKHRWDKGKKNGSKLPNGDKIIFLKVGGRTSAVVPSVQKKTGDVAGDVDTEGVDPDEDDVEEKPKKPAKGVAKRKGAAKKEGEDSKPAIPAPTKRGRKKPAVKEEEEEDPEDEEEEVPKTKKQKTAANGVASKAATGKGQKEQPKTPAKEESASGKRRSARVSSS